MRYRIAVHQSEEGFSVSVPGFQGAGLRALPTLRRLKTLRTRFVNILP